MDSKFNSSRPNLAVTVSGSFHRHMSAISSAVNELADAGIRVLSPADPRVVAAQGEFLFVASDRVRSVRLVQDRHLESIRAADFLWLVCPDGYVGQSASMELGFAAAAGVPIYATHAPTDLTLREYVNIVPSLAEAMRNARANPRSKPCPGFLIDPHASIEAAHGILDELDQCVAKAATAEDSAGAAYRDLANLRELLATPGFVQ